MGEFKGGKLRSSSGRKVTSKDQAIAIALSEQRKADKGFFSHMQGGQKGNTVSNDPYKGI